jgi:6-phosphofructokinase 1
MVVRAIFQDRPQLDFSNPNWKKQFQEEFDRRFSLPHLTDVIDVESRPTTFSLKSRWDVCCLPFLLLIHFPLSILLVIETDLFMIAVMFPLSTTRTPLENVNGSLEESWNGYVNDDDRALLKVSSTIE